MHSYFTQLMTSELRKSSVRSHSHGHTHKLHIHAHLLWNPISVKQISYKFSASDINNGTEVREDKNHMQSRFQIQSKSWPVSFRMLSYLVPFALLRDTYSAMQWVYQPWCKGQFCYVYT